MTVSEALAEYVKEKERVFEHDRSQTVGASEIGLCPRKVFALKFENTSVGIERDEDYVETWGARTRGTLIENYLIVPAMHKRYGKAAKLLGSQQQTFVDGFLSCTPDCLIDLENNCFVIEFKTKDPRVNLVEPKPEHIFQAQVQMGMLHAKTDYRPTHAIISYTDASFLNDTVEFIINREPQLYEAAKLRAARIMTGSFDELDPEGHIAGGKQCDYCAFTKACGISRRQIPGDNNITPVDPQFVAELADRARLLKHVEDAIALSEKQKRELQYEIKERMREKGQRRIVGDGVSISWTAVKPRVTVDVESLTDECTRAGIDVTKHTKVGEGGDRLTVTIKNRQAAA